MSADQVSKTRVWKLHPRLWLAYGLIVGLIVAFTAWQEWVYERRAEAVSLRSSQLHNAAAALGRRLFPAAPVAGPGPSGLLYQWRPALYLDLQSPFQSLQAFVRNAMARARQKPPPTREEVERTLGTTLSCQPNSGALVCEYLDRDGVPYLMAFERTAPGGLMAVEVERPFFPKPAEYPLQSDLFAAAWWGMLQYDLWLMLALAVLCVAHRRRRVLWAEVLLMAAIGRIITRWPRLGSTSLQQYLNADFLPWAMTVLCACVCMLIWAYYNHRERSLVRCPACDYNLVGGEARICPECGTPVRPEIRERILHVASLQAKSSTPVPSL